MGGHGRQSGSYYTGALRMSTVYANLGLYPRQLLCTMGVPQV